MDALVSILITGIGATAVMDLWGLVRQALLSQRRPDYRLVGRWIAHMRHGRFRHDSIAGAPPIRGERIIGWTAHYLIGTTFASLLIGAWGLAWVRHPTLGPALLVGIGTVAAPLFLMQPGMGMGLAARRTPRPWAARFQSLLTHTVFGVGLYAAGWVARSSLAW